VLLCHVDLRIQTTSRQLRQPVVFLAVRGDLLVHASKQTQQPILQGFKLLPEQKIFCGWSGSSLIRCCSA
jgi:hypothetical protein